MRLLVVGGAGKVGRIVVPELARQHEVVVLDRVPPDYDGAEFVPGDITAAATWDALPERDAIVFMAMASVGAPGDQAAAAAQFDVSVRGLYLALQWAGRTGVGRAVFASSLTVFATPPGGRYPADDAPTDAVRAYGLAKRCGEEVCRAASEEFGMTVTALRLAHPSTSQEWAGPVYPTATSPGDVTRAFQSALLRTRGGFATAPVSGDRSGRYVDLEPTRRLLGWAPLDHPAGERPWPVIA